MDTQKIIALLGLVGLAGVGYYLLSRPSGEEGGDSGGFWPIPDPGGKRESGETGGGSRGEGGLTQGDPVERRFLDMFYDIIEAQGNTVPFISPSANDSPLPLIMIQNALSDANTTRAASALVAKALKPFEIFENGRLDQEPTLLWRTQQFKRNEPISLEAVVENPLTDDEANPVLGVGRFKGLDLPGGTPMALRLPKWKYIEGFRGGARRDDRRTGVVYYDPDDYSRRSDPKVDVIEGGKITLAGGEGFDLFGNKAIPEGTVDQYGNVGYYIAINTNIPAEIYAQIKPDGKIILP